MSSLWAAWPGGVQQDSALHPQAVLGADSGGGEQVDAEGEEGEPLGRGRRRAGRPEEPPQVVVLRRDADLRGGRPGGPRPPPAMAPPEAGGTATCDRSAAMADPNHFRDPEDAHA